MRAFSIALALIAILWSSAADACRCAQQSLAEYFERADVVVIARLQESAVTSSERRLSFELLAPAYKSARHSAAGSSLSVTTATSSAACAVAAQPGAIYIVFAHRDGETLRADSCNGTRVHLPADGGEPSGFVDVPARFVAQQLNGLAGMQVLQQVISSQPQPDDGGNDSLIGLAAVGALANNGSLPLYLRPSVSTPPLLTIDNYASIESREYGYEMPGAIVFARLPGWLRLRLADGRHAWLEENDSTTFLPYPEIVVRRLTYLTPNWSGFVWPEPGAGLPLRDLRAGAGQEIPVEVHEVRLLAGTPFLRVTILENGPCSGNEPRERFSGWIPAFGANGRETAWFYSRGC